MKTKEEITDKISVIEQAYAHVLQGEFATVYGNAPRAIMQIEAKSKLEALYWVLGKECPNYEYEKGNAI